MLGEKDVGTRTNRAMIVDKTVEILLTRRDRGLPVHEHQISGSLKFFTLRANLGITLRTGTGSTS